MNEVRKFLLTEPIYLLCRWHDLRVEAHRRAAERHHAATVRLSGRGLAIIRRHSV